MRKWCSVDHATVQRRPRRAITAGARRPLPRAMAIAAVFLPLLALLATVGPASADTTGYTNTLPPDSPKCPAGTYTVPSGTRYVQVIANGGAGSDGVTDTINPNSTGGKGGTGARMTAIFPVTPGQLLYVVVGRAGANGRVDDTGWPDGGQNGFDQGQGGGSSFVTTQPLFARSGCQDGTKDTTVNPPTVMNLDRSKFLILAGGGGGGGGGGTFGSGGNGGNAGARSDFGGEAGSDAYDGGCDRGRAGGGASLNGPGTYGSGGCLSSENGSAGNGFYGGAASFSAYTPVAGQGAGGGGWYGGGSGGPSAGSLGGGGGGAGSSYVSSAARSSIIRKAVDDPSVIINSLDTPTTTASTGTGTPLADWYTSAPTISLMAHAGTFGVDKTYYAIDNPACTYAARDTVACKMYSSPFSIGSGLHTLTYFSVDAQGLDEIVNTRSFAVTPTSAGVTAASIGSGTNPTATAGGAAGSVSVSATGSGLVGAAVYSSNPAGAPVFNSSGAYVDVTVAGSGLSSVTIKDCNLNGGTNVYWNTGTGWALVSNQTYDPATRCVTVTVNSTTVPTLSQLTGTPIAAGSPPSIAAVATTADGKPYTAGAWTNQSVTVAFTCSANATPTAPVTRASDGQNQSASAICTDGLGQKATMTFTGINVDKTPPTCSIQVSPTVLWPPNSKHVAITETVTVGDNLSGIARVVGGTVTSNEALGSGDVQGFTVNATYASPLERSAVLNLTGTLVAKRAGDGSGRIYSQLVTVTDQAGNTASCTWTVTVPHDQGNAG